MSNKKTATTKTRLSIRNQPLHTFRDRHAYGFIFADHATQRVTLTFTLRLPLCFRNPTRTDWETLAPFIASAESSEEVELVRCSCSLKRDDKNARRVRAHVDLPMDEVDPGLLHRITFAFRDSESGQLHVARSAPIAFRHPTDAAQNAAILCRVFALLYRKAKEVGVGGFLLPPPPPGICFFFFPFFFFLHSQRSHLAQIPAKTFKRLMCMLCDGNRRMAALFAPEAKVVPVERLIQVLKVFPSLFYLLRGISPSPFSCILASRACA
jgi:hypothetical protein